ncbi:right-handed parallel beta-helix repeat-containing protein [Bacillus massiliglaciei]|uniref:right-handed parallel beta-helix repeat-containing protein n=1 Tax=Bacillus massiliglaciei TaxID=1816693 RepID=UPI000A4B563C|nr:right-handed parallel beta-helix repeat-containing protein [Bacillus massiliglaciei]
MRMLTKKVIYLFFSSFIFAMCLSGTNSADAANPVYTIKPGSKPADTSMLKFSTYNTHTKHYYLLRSYLEKLEQKGGGSLVLTKGTYTISNTLYVPSNVTIRLKDGAKLVKGNQTGTSKFKASTSMFQLIRPSKSKKKAVFGLHQGEKNISFIGEGNASVDLKYLKDRIAIIMGHNQNIKVEHLTFKNMNSGHFIEMDASNGVKIQNNTFQDSKASANKVKEAINIDTPDRSTNGWSQEWSKFDKTPNQNVLIEKNSFKNLDRAVGTHKYSGGKYHNKIIIRNNKIENTRSDAIRVLNWSNSIIEKNSFLRVANGKPGIRGILASGTKNPLFQKNTFSKVGRAMQFMAWKNDGPGSQYAITYNRLSSANKKALMTNHALLTTESFIRINKQYKEYVKNTEKIQIQTK